MQFLRMISQQLSRFTALGLIMSVITAHEWRLDTGLNTRF